MASADGYFYMFDVNTQEGGICKLLTQASIYTPNPTLFTNNSMSKDLVNNNNNNNANAINATAGTFNGASGGGGGALASHHLHNPHTISNNNSLLNHHHHQQQQQQQQPQHAYEASNQTNEFSWMRERMI